MGITVVSDTQIQLHSMITEISDGHRTLESKAFRWNESEILWSLTCTFGYPSSSKASSVLKIEESSHLTAKLLTELFFYRELHDMYECEIKSLKIIFSYPSDRHEAMHLIEVTGFGNHSRWDDKPSDFKFTTRCNDAMQSIVKQILRNSGLEQTNG